MTEEDEAPPRYLELLQILTRHGAEFVVVGGFAVILHGYERMTTNIDVVAEASRENFDRFRAALVKLDAEPAEQMWVEGGRNWVLHTKLGRIDVMQSVAGIESYAELWANAIAIEIPQVGDTVWFAGFDDLIEMKRAAGRDQDLMDITALRMAHGLEE